MLADLIRAFCKESESNYKVYENYSTHKTTIFGEMTITTIGIVVKQDRSCYEMIEELARYLMAKGFEDLLLELEGPGIDEFGPDAIVYFPAMRDYHPLQP